MSIVAVHGPQTFGSKAVSEAGPVMVTVNPTNGLIWDFKLDSVTTRSAQDFSWAFPPDGTISPQVAIDPTPVTYATPGAKTATLTVSNTARTVSNKALTNNVATITTTATHGYTTGQWVTIAGVDATFNGTQVITATPSGTTFTFDEVAANVTSAASGGTVTSATNAAVASQYPASGAYPINITAVTGTGPPGTSLRSAPPEEGGEEDSGEVQVGYDPAAHTVAEVEEFVTAHPDQLQEIYDTEVAGKNRATLVNWLEVSLPFDPGSHTVAEVEEFVTANPDLVDDVLAAEETGKARVTLITWLEDFQP